MTLARRGFDAGPRLLEFTAATATNPGRHQDGRNQDPDRGEL